MFVLDHTTYFYYIESDGSTKEESILSYLCTNNGETSAPSQAGDSKKFKAHQADRKGKGKGKDSFIGASSVPEIWELGIKELLALGHSPVDVDENCPLLMV
ncbi:hypothetical protein H5410_008398 [Solanum commersonii]|uniref:Uncharacterized protein n=1 Tax=Solanum commersonii TaxID=4109 RepID=A0A9J6AFW4_SOLCO|nr:hypothetical protein H5410_008398 [Solanum commersonii]